MMKRRYGVFGAGMILAMVVSCSRGQPDQPTTAIPPAPTTPPAVTSPIGGYEVSTVSDGGSIAGTISLSGSVPKLPVRKPNKDPQVCGTAVRESQKLIVSKSGGLKNAVVIVEGVKRGKAVPAAVQNAEF